MAEGTFMLFAFVTTKVAGDANVVIEKLFEFEKIAEIYGITGEIDLLLKLKCTDFEELKDLLNKIRQVPGVLMVNSHVVFQKYR